MRSKTVQPQPTRQQSMDRLLGQLATMDRKSLRRLPLSVKLETDELAVADFNEPHETRNNCEHNTWSILY
jgi:hypothetical protein